MTGQNVPMEGGVEQSMPSFTDQYVEVCSSGAELLPTWALVLVAFFGVWVCLSIAISLLRRG